MAGSTIGLGLARQEQLLALLGQADQRHVVEAHRVHDLARGADLALAAVDDHQVRHAPAQLLGAPLLRGHAAREAARSTSWWLAKSLGPWTVLMRKRRYSPDRGRPSSNTTMLPTV